MLRIICQDDKLGFGIGGTLANPTLKVKRLTESSKLPTRNKPHDAGIDFYADENCSIEPLSSPVLVKTGVSVAFPAGMALLLWDRSGLASKHGIHRLAGVIDHGYTGEILVCLVNFGEDTYEVKKGDKIVQGVLTPIFSPDITEVSTLEQTERGEAGFGSSGK